MSSITPSDRSSQTDDIRRMREEYENQESEATKRKNREIRNLNQNHEKELKSVEDSYDKNLETMRNKHAEIIDERDRKHNDDVTKIRDMYMGSLRKKGEEDLRERDELKSSFHNELDTQKKTTEEQRNAADRGFRNSIRERDRQMEEYSDRTTSQLKEGLEDRTSKLNAKHEAESKASNDDKERIRRELGGTIADMKATNADETAARERSYRADTARRESATENIFRNQEAMNSHMLETRDQELREERNKMHTKMADSLRGGENKMEQLRQNYADEMESRTGASLRRAQADMSEAKNEQVIDAVTNRRLRDLDHEHLLRSYQDRENDLVRQRDEALATSNDRAQGRVDEILDKTNKAMSEQNRHTRMDQSMEDMRRKEAMSQQETMYKDQIDHTNTRAEERVRKVMNATAQSEKQEVRQHEQNLSELRQNYGDNLQNQREAQLESLQQVYSRMNQKLRDQEAGWMKKHDNLVEEFNARLDESENGRKADLHQLEQTYEARMAAREKAVKMEEDTMTSKFDQKFAQQEAQHDKEIERLERRHKEQMQELAARTNANYNSRKA